MPYDVTSGSFNRQKDNEDEVFLREYIAFRFVSIYKTPNHSKICISSPNGTPRVNKQTVDNLSTSWNKQFEQILLTSCWNRIAASLLQVCYNMWDFKRVK
jgi:hypothetical protein